MNLDLTNKTVLVTGVADNVGFGWHIAKRLAEFGAEIIISCHPRILPILERYLTKDKYLASRKLKNNQELKPKLVISCDVGLDKYENLSTEQKNSKGYDNQDVSIQGLVQKLKAENIKLDGIIHSIAFSPEITKNHMDVSREGYLCALSISSYSLVALTRELLDLMKNNGGSIVGLSYLAGERAVPFYGGGMASAKAALECDARMLSWGLGERGHRINIISAGPYASRAAKSIGDVDKMVEKTKNKSPLRRPISPEDVADTALFLVSDLSKNITGETIHVDAGFHAMALV